MARRFRFRLETVRRLRQQALDAQRRVVAGAVRAVVRVEDRIAALSRRSQGDIDRSREELQVRRLDMVSLRGHQAYQEWLKRETARTNERLTQKRAELDAERSRLAETSNRLKVIEKLRERQWSRYRFEVGREEQAVSDEAALQRYVRRGGEPGCEVVA